MLAQLSQHFALGAPEAPRLVYEALAHAARSDEVAAGAGEALAAVTSSLSDANAQRAWHQALSDAMWLLDVETGMGSDEAMRARFVGMVRAAHMRQAVPRAALEKALDVRLLEEAGVVKSGQQFFKALVLHNTRLNLTQPTWFLFSEGSEGYAKFAVELAYGDPRRDTAATLRAIIGHFSLHYGRCADVALDMWPRFPRRAHCVVDLLRTIPRNLLCQVVALRLQQDYQSQSMQCSSDLINALVMLLEMDLVDLGAIYDALLPSDEDATKFFEEQKQFLSSYKHTGASVVSLGTSSSSAASLGGDADDEGRASSRRGAAPEETSGPSVSTPAAAASTSNVVIKSSAFPYEAGALRAMAKNQKFDLARRLLRAGHWPQASALLKLLVQQGLALCVELQHELALFVERMIEPLYRTPAVCGPVASRNPSSLAQSDYVVRTFDEITSRLLPVLQLLGPALGTHPMAHAKVCRLLSAWMVHVEQSAADAETRAGVQQLVEGLMAKILLPGLAFIKSNPAAAGAAFGVIKDLPFEARCRVYASWRRDGAKHVLVAFSRAEAETEIKAILRRLNAERAAIVAYGRAVGGISHSHPLLVFDAIVAQLQQYVNMIGPVVDFLRYQSLLARDALVFVLLEGLASKKKATHKSDGTNLAEWLSALATAIGLLYKKYKDIDARPLLQLLRNKLLDGSTAELTVLEHLVTRMSGLEGAGAGMSEKQAAAQAGSAQLKASARPIPAPPGIGASASRLRRALDSTGIAPQLLVLIVQTGLKNTIYTAVDEEASLKMISDAYDKAMSVWLQFLAFLEQTYEPEALSAALPSLSDLVLKHRLAPSEALTALRSVLRLRYSDVEWLVEGTGEPPHQQQQQQQQEAEPGMALLPRLTDEVGIVAGLSPALTPVLYAAFWSLRLSDIVWPKESYDDVTLKLQKRIQEATSGVGQFEEWDASKRLKEVDKIKAQLAKLAEDCEAQQAHVTVVRAHFKAQASEWLKAVEPEHHNDLVLDFLQHCIHFRSKMSAEDAIFCAEFVRLLEDTGTHFFSSANFLHHLVQYSSFTMGSTTENEAANFGRYLGLTLARINRLRANEDDFEATKKLVCFKKDFNYATSEDWSYMEYLLLARKWHRRIAMNAVKCLDSTEYLVLRNGLVVLTKIVDEFPLLESIAHSLTKRVKAIIEKSTEMSDVRLLATRYDALLAKRSEQCISEDAFFFKVPATPAVVPEAEPVAVVVVAAPAPTVAAVPSLPIDLRKDTKRPREPPSSAELRELKRKVVESSKARSPPPATSSFSSGARTFSRPSAFSSSGTSSGPSSSRFSRKDEPRKDEPRKDEPRKDKGDEHRKGDDYRKSDDHRKKSDERKRGRSSSPGSSKDTHSKERSDRDERRGRSPPRARDEPRRFKK